MKIPKCFHTLAAVLLFVGGFCFVSQSTLWVKASQLLYSAQRTLLRTRVLSACDGYMQAESRYAVLYYTKADEDFILLIAQAVDLYYPLLAQDFGLSAKPKAPVVIYPEETLLYEAVGVTYSRPPLGIYYGGVINILSPRRMGADLAETEIKSLFLTKGPLVHELAHYVMDQKAAGNYDLWLTEGVALYYEYKYTAFEWRSDLQEKSRAIKLAQLVENFRYIDEGLAYRRSFDIVKALADSHGETGLQALIAQLGQGRRIKVLGG